MTKKKPNIVLILADDMGYSDIGCYGGEIETPNLDRLAADGLRFTQFYNTARCCPTRASLLTGLHPHQTGIGILTYDSGPDGYAGDLNRRCVTIAEVLKAAGYRTYMSGKWHVARSLTEPTDTWPLQRGFDDFYGTIIGAGSYYDPEHADARQRQRRARGARPIRRSSTPTRSATRRSRFIDAALPRRTPTQPFFLYVAYTAPHWPLHAHDEDIAKYKGRFDDGWDRLRERAARTAGQVPASSTPPGSSTPRDPTQPPWTEAEHKALAAALHGGLRRADRPHGPGHRPHPRGAERNRPARQHADHLPLRQRRLRRGHSRRASRSTSWSNKLMIARVAHARRRAGPFRQRPDAHARARRTPTRATAPPGPTCRTRRSASTSTGSTRAASRRR